MKTARAILFCLLFMSPLGLAADPSGLLPRVRWWLECRGWIASPDRPLPELLTIEGVETPVPFGVPSDSFEANVRAWFRSHPEIPALAFFGSRTHFSHGYLPDFEKSDLDILLYHPFKMDTFPFRRQVHESFPSLRSQIVTRFVGEQEILSDRSLKFPASLEEERKNYMLAERRASRRLIAHASQRREWRDLMWARNPYILELERRQVAEGRFNLFEPPPVVVVVNKEAVFFIRESPDSAVLEEGLRALGFQNVIVLKKD